MIKFVTDWLTGVKPPAAESELCFRVFFNKLEIGALTRDLDEWVFRYADEFRAQDKVKPIVDFPNVEKEYRNAQLWPFFLLRIPSPTQPAVRYHLEKHRLNQLEEVDEGTLLREFGRWSVANPFELQPA